MVHITYHYHRKELYNTCPHRLKRSEVRISSPLKASLQKKSYPKQKQKNINISTSRTHESRHLLPAGASLDSLVQAYWFLHISTVNHHPLVCPETPLALSHIGAVQLWNLRFDQSILGFSESTNLIAIDHILL